MKYRITVINANMDSRTIYFAPHFSPIGNGTIRVSSAFRLNPTLRGSTDPRTEKVNMLFITGPIIEIVEITDTEFNKMIDQKSDSQE